MYILRFTPNLTYMMRFSTFMQYALSDSNLLKHQGTRYIHYHAERFYQTYQVCAKLLNERDHLVSVGAGSAIVEKVLARANKVQVSVVDFPNAIALNEKYYTHLGFKAIGLDLSNNEISLPPNAYDLLLSGEIIEHVPKSPYDQIKGLNAAVKPGGKVVITTPNMGSIAHIMKVILMRPLLPPAQQTFSSVGFKNEGVHRREYMPREIIADLHQLGYHRIKTNYIHYSTPHGLKGNLLFLAGKLSARFRPAMIITGEKQ